jgi:hypothetical protein
MFRPTNTSPTRRSFLQSLTALGTLTVLRPFATAAAATAPIAASDGPWDLSWLDQLTGQHKQVFDLGTLVGRVGPLHIVTNYLDAHREVFNLNFPAINAVVGIAYAAFPLNASDALWRKYGLGERWQVKDPTTGAWAVRNIWADAPAGDAAAGETVKTMKARGVIFWQCNHALNAVARELAEATHAPFDAVRAELIGGLLPGVHLIPAHTMLIGLAQEHGCTYERV